MCEDREPTEQDWADALRLMKPEKRKAYLEKWADDLTRELPLMQKLGYGPTRMVGGTEIRLPILYKETP